MRIIIYTYNRRIVYYMNEFERIYTMGRYSCLRMG